MDNQSTAYWIEDDCCGVFYWCSNCNRTSDEKTERCPKCGALMAE